MSHRLLFIIGASLTILQGCSVSSRSGAPRRGYDVYLLIGQSNMVGFAGLEKGDEQPVEGVWLLNGEGVPEPATNPLNRYSTINRDRNNSAFGPGDTFSRRMHDNTGRKILLVVNARGNTGIKLWMPGTEYYNEAVSRTRQALRYGTLKGILWHQGEADARWPQRYMARLDTLVSSLRRDLGGREVPFVAGEVGYFFTAASDGTNLSGLINPVLDSIPQRISRSACVSAEGLGHRGDKIHFSHEAYEELGRRYADALISLR